MSLALHQHPLVQDTVGPQCSTRIEVFAINRVPAPGSGHCQERVSLFSRCTADHAFWVRAIPCSTVAQQRHKIIRNGVALVREVSVSVGHLYVNDHVMPLTCGGPDAGNPGRARHRGVPRAGA